MPIVSTEIFPDTTDTDLTGDIPLVLTAGVVRSDPVDGASLVIVSILTENASTANFLSAEDDATFDAFYGTGIWADGLNHYGPEIFGDSGEKRINRVGLILNGLAPGDTITLHFDAPVGEYRCYARAYTGVNIDRCWTAPDEVTMNDLFYLGGDQTPFQTLDTDDSTDQSLQIVAEQNGGGSDITSWSIPLQPFPGNPHTTGGDLLLVTGFLSIGFGVFPSGPIVWDDAGLIEKWGFNDVYLGADVSGHTLSWVEKVVAASDIIDLQETLTNPFHQDTFFQGNVLRAGPGPYFCDVPPVEAVPTINTHFSL